MQTTRENTEQNGATGATIPSLPQTDYGACHEHRDKIAAETAGDGRQPPDNGHGRGTFHSAPTIGQQGHRKGHEPYGQRDGTDQRTQLSVTQRPFSLKRRKNGIDDLARHVVGQHQTKR
ncbi:hypothetical protein D3C81_1082930 [compost metagenome]